MSTPFPHNYNTEPEALELHSLTNTSSNSSRLRGYHITGEEFAMDESLEENPRVGNQEHVDAPPLREVSTSGE